MADDSTVEETKETLIQRFRAWGGKWYMHMNSLASSERPNKQ